MPQGRRSRLVIRRVDPWSILKFSVLLYLSVYFVILVAGVVLWSAATAAGVRGKIESFIGELIAAQDFKFKAGQIFRSSAIGGVILVGLGTLVNVLMAVLFNLISDVVGGVGISVEERAPRRRRSILPGRRGRGGGGRPGDRALDRPGGRSDRPGRNGGTARNGRPNRGDRPPRPRQTTEGEVTSELGG